METNNTNPAIKISLIIVAVVVVLLVIGYALGAFRSDIPTDQGMMQTAGDDSVQMVTITSTTTVESDIDSYLNSSDGVPPSSDFNDSYSDLNQ